MLPLGDLSHGSLDRQRNDRLGRHRKNILQIQAGNTIRLMNSLDNYQHHPIRRLPELVTQRCGLIVKWSSGVDTGRSRGLVP